MEPSNDAVDMLLEQWAKQRPDLDVRPMAVITRITRVSRMLQQALKAHLAEHGVEDWEFDVLATLRRHDGGPLTAGELVASSMVSSASMTNRIDRLTARGLVTRRVDPTNRRRVLIELTAAGRELVDEVAGAHLAYQERLLAGLGTTNQQRLGALLRRLAVTLGDGPR
jgi:DNA-binding MarR family transcriptional regulator